MLYLLALFLHVTGSLMLAAAIAIEWLSVVGLRKAASLDRARESLSIYSKLSMVGGIGMFLILIPGIYMAMIVIVRSTSSFSLKCLRTSSYTSSGA